MMAPASTLPAFTPAVARLRTRLLAALAGRRINGRQISASLVAADPLACAWPVRAWVGCGGGVAVAPLRAAGQALPLLADDGAPDAALAIDALDRLEPLLLAIETALGIELHPDHVAATPPPGVWLQVGGDGDALLLALAETALVAPLPLPADAAALIGWRLRLPGPRLLRPRRLARGDLLPGLADCGLVVVGNRGLPARLGGAGATIIDEWRMVMDSDDPADLADASVAVRAELAGAPMRLGDLSRLQPGAVLPLAAGRPVVVWANGAAFATGTLVAVGDGHGVLIDAVQRGVVA